MSFQDNNNNNNNKFDDDDNEEVTESLKKKRAAVNSNDEPEARPPAQRDNVVRRTAAERKYTLAQILRTPSATEIKLIKLMHSILDTREFQPDSHSGRANSEYFKSNRHKAEDAAKMLGIRYKRDDNFVIVRQEHSLDLALGCRFLTERKSAEANAVEQKLINSGFENVPSAVRAVRLIAGRPPSRAMSLDAAMSVIDATIAEVRERFNALRALAARVDVHELPFEADVSRVLDGTAPPISVLANVCDVVVWKYEETSWRTVVASRCNPIAKAIEETTMAALKREIGQSPSPVFGIDEKNRWAWLVGAVRDDEIRLAKFDACLAQCGIFGRLSLHLQEKREEFKNACGIVTDRLNSIDAELDAFLATERVRNEIAARVEMDKVLTKLRHEHLRDRVLGYVLHELDSQEPKPVRDVVFGAIASHRAEMFASETSDIAIVSWDGMKICSDVVARMKTQLADPRFLVADGKTSEVVVSKAVALAEAQMAEWKIVQENSVAIYCRRKAKLDELLESRGFRGSGFLVVRHCGTLSIEIDVRHKTVVEFTGRDPPPPVGVDKKGRLFSIDRYGDRVRMVTREDALTLPFGAVSFGDVSIETFWGAETLDAECAVLRWPPRLSPQNVVELWHVVENLDVPVCLPVAIEMRAARRATLLAALRSHGMSDKRIPLTVEKNFANGLIYGYLCKTQWPRSRALAASLVGDVALSMQRDIFAALPRLVIGIICSYLDDAGDEKGFDSLVEVSDAFALGAAVWVLDW